MFELSFPFSIVLLDQLCRCTCNSHLASLLDLALECDLVSITPHLRHECLPGDDWTGETNFDVLEGTEPDREAVSMCIILPEIAQ